jgi:hypothetical protein
MPALVHVLWTLPQGVDGRDKAGMTMRKLSAHYAANR